MNPRQNLKGIYAITPELRGQALLQAVERALIGGIRLLQYRNKTAASAERLEAALALRKLCEQYQVPLIINDDIELAKKSGAAGVHLGKNDPDMATARKQLGAKAIIGVSCYNQFVYALQAEKQDADYVAFGSVYSSPTKPGAVEAPLALFERAKAEIGIPICAIGGINSKNAAPLIERDVDLLAVISGIFAEKDIESATRRLIDIFKTRNPILQ